VNTQLFKCGWIAGRSILDTWKKKETRKAHEKKGTFKRQGPKSQAAGRIEKKMKGTGRKGALGGEVLKKHDVQLEPEADETAEAKMRASGKKITRYVANIRD